MQELKYRLSKKVPNPAQRAALPIDDRIRLTRRVVNLIHGMRMYGRDDKDIKEFFTIHGFHNEGELQGFESMLIQKEISKLKSWLNKLRQRWKNHLSHLEKEKKKLDNPLG